MNWDIFISKVTGYRLENQCSFSDWSGIFFFATMFRLALRPIQSPIQQALGAEHPGCKADHSPPSGVEV
jgi:hypothetical protein